VAGCCEHGDEPSISIKGAEFVGQLSDRSFSSSLLHGVTFYVEYKTEFEKNH